MKMKQTTTTKARRRRETGKGVCGGEKEGGRDLNVRGRQEGGGGGREKDFLKLVSFFIRSHGTKTENKSFFVSF